MPPLLLRVKPWAPHPTSTDAAYEPDITSKGVPEDILVALAATFRNGTYPGPPLPVKMFMLVSGAPMVRPCRCFSVLEPTPSPQDAYWMYNTRANGNCKSAPLEQGRGICCEASHALLSPSHNIQ